MKINEIPALAFAISENMENAFIDSAAKKAGRFDKSMYYMPLLLCSAAGVGRNSGHANRFFISLTNGLIYFLRHHGYADSIKKMFKREDEHEVPELASSDLLVKVRDFPPQLLREFGLLMETGTVRMVDIDYQRMVNLKQLVAFGFAESYTHQTTEYIRPSVKIPPLTSQTFDLSQHFEIKSVVDDAYARERLVLIPQQVCGLLELLYECRTSIEAVVYLPYIKVSYALKDHTESEIGYTAMPRNLKHIARKSEHPHELRPLMIGVKGEGINAMLVEETVIDFSHVAGMEKVKEEIRDAIVYPLKNPQLSKEFGQKAGGGILLYGPPGCGKTYIVRATVGEAGVNFYNINIQDIIGGDPNVGAKKLHDVFEYARKDAPAIVFFDEIDALSGKREASQSSFEHLVINQFLSEMDGLGNVNENVLVIGATNIPWGVDPAIRRAGRFTTKIYIPPPDPEARKAMFRSLLKGKPAAAIDVDRLAELTDGYSSADVTAICNDASKIPWGEALKGGPKRLISMDDFISVLNQRKTSLIPWFNLARRELEKSGEMKLYPALADYMSKKCSMVESGDATPEAAPPADTVSAAGAGEDVRMKGEKSMVERQISVLKRRHSSGEIGDDVYKELLKEYERKLIELEAWYS
jgi:transitional endoplasmic reticulum ATPase